jgi:hypothetical protein
MVGSPLGRRIGPPPTATRPGTNLNPLSVTDAGDIPLRHGSPFCRWRHFDMNRRRREHEFRRRRLEKTGSGLSPSTFGLSDAELRRHANMLVLKHGWSVAEVVQVLDVEPAGAR